MSLLLIIGAPLAMASALAGYGLLLRRSSPPAERPGWGWGAALVLVLLADVVLLLAFVLAIAVYNCHGAYDCPF